MERAVIKTVEDFGDFTEEFIEQERRGVIELPAPMLNINEWYPAPSYYALALDVNKEQFDRIAYYSDLVVKESELKEFSEGEILGLERFKKYESLSDEDKDKVSLVGGAEAIDFLIKKINLDERCREAREKEISLQQEKERLYDLYDELGGDEASNEVYKKASVLASDIEPDENGDINIPLSDEEQTLINTETSIDKVNTALSEIRCLLTALRRITTHDTDNLILKEIDIFPVDTRGIIKEMYEETPYAIYDIESAYYKVASRAERVRKLMDLGAPLVILRNEKRVLQESIDALINNGMRGMVKSARSPECAAASLTSIMLRRSKLV